MSITVITNRPSGEKLYIPLRDIVAFVAKDKCVEAHTSSKLYFFHSLVDTTKTEIVAPHICPHCRNLITGDAQDDMRCDKRGDQLISLRNIESFIGGRNTPLLRINRNCIINMQHVTGLEVHPAKLFLLSKTGRYEVSRRNHAIARKAATRHLTSTARDGAA